MASRFMKWREICVSLFQRSTAGYLRPNALNIRFFRFVKLPVFDKQMKSLVNASPSKIRNLRVTHVNVPLARPCSR